MKTEIEVTEGITLTLAAYNKLQAELTAERERRVAAEHAADDLHQALNWAKDATPKWGQSQIINPALKQFYEHHAKYPKGDDHG